MNDFDITKLIVDDVATVLDVMDLDEDLVDKILDKLFERKYLSTCRLRTILTLLKYKNIIYTREETDCDNDAYVDYTLKFLLKIHHEEKDCYILLEILITSLLLNKSKLLSFVEHILQQLIAGDEFKSAVKTESSNSVFMLKVVNKMLELSISQGLALFPMFLNNEIEKLIEKSPYCNPTFYSHTVPMIIKAYSDYSILDVIWENIVSNNAVNSNLKNDLIILCSLSQFYLPLELDSNQTTIKSCLAKKPELWKINQNGMSNTDYFVKKCSLYLLKRAIKYCEEKMPAITNQHIPSGIFYWNREESSTASQSWSAFIDLLETLEEKQSELVLAALKLFDCLQNIHHSWYYIVLRKALCHSSKKVVTEAVKISVTKCKIHKEFPFYELVTNLNNTYMFENFEKSENSWLKTDLEKFLNNELCLVKVLENMAKVKLAPIPRYYVYSVISNTFIENTNIGLTLFVQLFLAENESSNNSLFDDSIKGYFVDFVINHKLVQYADDCLHIIDIVNKEMPTGTFLWSKLLNMFVSHSYIFMGNFNLLEFCDKYMDSKINTESLALFLVLMIKVNAEAIQDLRIYLIKSLKAIHDCDLESSIKYEISDSKYSDEWKELIQHCPCDKLDEKCLRMIGFIVHKICDSKDTNEYEEISNFLYDIKEVLFDVIFNKIKHCDGMEDTCINAIVNCVNIYFFDMGSMTLLNEYKHFSKRCEIILKFGPEEIFKKYLILKIINSYVQCVHTNTRWPTHLKYIIINEFFNLVKNYPVSANHNKQFGNINSRINRQIIAVYSANYDYFEKWNLDVTSNLYEDINKFLEVGGNGCLKHIIDLSYKTIPQILEFLDESKLNFLCDFIWREITGIRKSGDFVLCMKSFIMLIFKFDLNHYSYLRDILFNYLSKIFELGEQKPDIVYELIIQTSQNVSNEDILIYILTKSLSFGSPLRKDQRIEEEITSNILKACDSPINDFYKRIPNLSGHVRAMAVHILLEQNADTCAIILDYLTNMVDSSYKADNRYHGNSMHHRTILKVAQLLCVTTVTCKSIHTTNMSYVNWCIKRLTNQPHHISTKIFLEWYISLYIHINALPLSEATVEKLKLNEIPQISHFTILFQVVKHRLNALCIENEAMNLKSLELCEVLKNDLEFVLDMFLEYTMAQTFNIRLHVQLYIKILLQYVIETKFYEKYSLYMKAIRKTLDKHKNEINVMKIQKDFYINNFDIVKSVSLVNIFHYILRLTNVAEDEWIPLHVLENLKYFSHCPDNFSLENVAKQEFFKLEEAKQEAPTLIKLAESNANIQKKFIPPTEILSEISAYEEKQYDRLCNELIVVASLVDRLPNLGGLSRTCEIFGVKKYVISSLRHVQDKQFLSTSMSSERWLDIVEIMPGSNLKEYLLEMKNIGYIIVGAEQTSSSVLLNTFKFPKKSLLLVGHEKDGIPCDLICLMDHCVEIPQYGMVRSLNVHVTASIFIWEYLKQHPFDAL